MPYRYLFPMLGLATVLALPEEEKAGMVDDYELNVATNCREYPAVGVTDPRTCSQIKHQVSQFNYNPVVGNNWNAGEPNNNPNQVKESRQWSGIQAKIWGDKQCKNIGNFKLGLEDCKKKCLETATCTAINFHSKDCTLRKCPQPVQPPQSQWGPFRGLYILDQKANYNPVVGCDAGWVANQDKCYKLEASPRTLDLAAADCGSKSAQLATIHNLETNLFIKNLLSISVANSIFLGAMSNAPNSMKWMVGVNVGDALVTQDFSNGGQTFENAVRTVTAGQVVVMTKGNDEWEIIDNTAHTTRPYVCEKNQISSNVGFCRWDAFRANTDVKSACMCPTSINVCSKRPNCFWYEDPNSPFKECISNSERFYNMLHRLLVRRGKKDFAIKIRYGSTPASGQMPFGPYGPAVIGAGNPNPTSMFGVYGHKNPYDRQRGMGMFGNQGHFGPRRQSQMDSWGQSLPGQSQFGFTRGLQGQPAHQMWKGQSGQQMSGQRQQLYHEGNRFNPYRQQNHKQY